MGDFLASVTSTASTYNYSNYDALARPGAGSQTTGSQTWTFPSVVWTPQGQVGSITYPSGRVVTTGFNAAGQVSSVTGSLSGTSTHYVTGASYAAHGGLTQWSADDSVTRIIGYNQRLQPASVIFGPSMPWIMNLTLNWGSVQNNGNLQSQTITRGSFTATQSYFYDQVNRLTSASEPTWTQSFVYDNVGNRAVTGNSYIPVANYTPQTSLTSSPPPGNSTNWPFDPATNHWAAPAAAYDQAGNMIAVRTQSMGFDAESRMTSWSDSSTGASVSFAYDGDGRRVSKTSSSGTTTYIFDPAGNLAVESGGPAPTSTGPLYLTGDHLGSVRLVTNASGGCVGAHDYLPFGEEIPGTKGRTSVPCYPTLDTQADTALKFTGQERDNETLFDNFLARNFAGAQGRFLSVDPGNAGGNPGDPQSWNGYGYAGNNPMVNSDPSGTDCVNGVSPQTGNICTTATAQAPVDNSFLIDLFFNRIGGQIQQTAYDLTDRYVRFITAPRDQNCVAAAAAAGSVIGTGLGAQAGGALGTTVGAGAGTFALPGGGTIAGGAVGFGVGSAAGGVTGYYGGRAIGSAVGWLACSTNAGPSSGGSNTGGASSDSTGRAAPKNLKEQLALDQAKSDPAGGTPVPLKKGMTDPRWPGSEGWQKMAQNVNGIEVHYVWNPATGAAADFKFK